MGIFGNFLFLSSIGFKLLTDYSGARRGQINKGPFQSNYIDPTKKQSHCTTALPFNNSPNKASAVDTVRLYIGQISDMPLSISASISHKPVLLDGIIYHHITPHPRQYTWPSSSF